MHGKGIFDHRIFGGRGVFGMQVPTEHDPSRPRPITAPVPGQPVVVGSAIPVQDTQAALKNVSRVMPAMIGVRAPNFPAGAVYPVGAAIPVQRQAAALLPVSRVAAAALPIGAAKQVFQGYGSPDGLGFRGFGGLVGFSGLG